MIMHITRCTTVYDQTHLWIGNKPALGKSGEWDFDLDLDGECSEAILVMEDSQPVHNMSPGHFMFELLERMDFDLKPGQMKQLLLEVV